MTELNRDWLGVTEGQAPIVATALHDGFDNADLACL